MYKIEVLTPSEELLKELYFQTWGDTYRKIIDLKNQDLNLKIDIFKENTEIKNTGEIIEKSFEYLGDFSKVRTKEPEKIKRKINTKPIKKICIILLFLLLFPVMLLLEMIKEK